jgi:DNA repair protein RecN (Recombination protein N)
MLTELRIDNFAIIQHLELQFKDGLTTFTGETGAGKSILLDALIGVIGGKLDTTFIRSGAERAQVEATFQLPQANRDAILDLLRREDLLDEPESDVQEVTLAREIRREGRTTARVNGRSVSVGLLRDLGSTLLDIHGQSEHLSLLNVRQHLGLLDRYTGDAAALEVYRKVYRDLLALRRELNGLRQGEIDSARRSDFLTFQFQEIESAHLQPGEDEELLKERDRLANAESLADLAQKSVLLLDEGDPESPAISDLTGQIVQNLSALSRIDPSMDALYQQAIGAAEIFSDLARDLRDYVEQVEFNPRRLEQVEDRLDLIHNLERKYGGSIAAILAFAEDARAQLETISNAGERIAELEEQESRLLAELARHGQALSQARRAAAETLAAGVEAELNDLSMAGARFSVDIHYRPDPVGVVLADGQKVAFDDTGLDAVEFLIAPNPGEGLKPLVKIASGGETSRLMLALKNVLARADDIPTLIFDEIDQGIGGRVGTVVGEKLWQLARRHQVLCVTHLPQLAAFGDQHYRVQKRVQEGRTSTHVEPLGGPVRLDELAQMMGSVTNANRSAAQETLEEAHRRAAAFAQRR